MSVVERVAEQIRKEQATPDAVKAKNDFVVPMSFAAAGLVFRIIDADEEHRKLLREEFGTDIKKLLAILTDIDNFLSKD
jgi:(p)ppGpp synthase/HD superfamily hydrolase